MFCPWIGISERLEWDLYFWPTFVWSAPLCDVENVPKPRKGDFVTLPWFSSPRPGCVTVSCGLAITFNSTIIILFEKGSLNGLANLRTRSRISKPLFRIWSNFSSSAHLFPRKWRNHSRGTPRHVHGPNLHQNYAKCYSGAKSRTPPAPENSSVNYRQSALLLYEMVVSWRRHPQPDRGSSSSNRKPLQFTFRGKFPIVSSTIGAPDFHRIGGENASVHSQENGNGVVSALPEWLPFLVVSKVFGRVCWNMKVGNYRIELYNNHVFTHWYQCYFSEHKYRWIFSFLEKKKHCKSIANSFKTNLQAIVLLNMWVFDGNSTKILRLKTWRSIFSWRFGELVPIRSKLEW